jgi:type I restriction enzyme R subunit
MKTAVAAHLDVMVRRNPTRRDLRAELTRIVERYNQGAENVEAFFAELVAFTKRMEEEDRRSVREGISEEELALVDLMKRPEVPLTDALHDKLKVVARELLRRLPEKLVIDWKRSYQRKAAVKKVIERALEELPQDAYSDALYEDVCGAVFDHVFESYYGEGKSKYATGR